MHLIKQWLKAPVIGEDERGVKKTVGGGKANRMGTPQGGVISPLLANCYLHILDRLWQRRHLKGKLQAHLVRYADDFVVMCRQDVEEPLTALTGRELTAIPLDYIVDNVNRSLRGWANYFHYRNSSLAMSKVRNHAEERLRTHLMKLHKVKDRGTGLRRFPRTDLYKRYGLYKVPTVAGWRSAHALV